MAPIADDDEIPASAPAEPDVFTPGFYSFGSDKTDTVAPAPETQASDVTNSIAPKNAGAASVDLMCADAPAGFVKPVPAPFKFWMVLVCAPQAQALVPVAGMVWFAHGTKEPVSVLALPPGVAAMPRTADYNPSYNVRFKDMYASEVTGKKRARAVSMLDAAQSKRDAVLSGTEVERVYQLDAVSSIYDMRYNIYFYVSDNLPRAALICIDACRQMLLLDVLNNDEAQVRLAGP